MSVDRAINIPIMITLVEMMVLVGLRVTSSSIAHT
jgi:hypothetical protein